MSRIALLPLSGRAVQSEYCLSGLDEGEVHQAAARRPDLDARPRSRRPFDELPLRGPELGREIARGDLAAFSGAPRRRRWRRRSRAGRTCRDRGSVRTRRHRRRWRRWRRRRRRARRRHGDLRTVRTGLHCRRRRRPRRTGRKNDRCREDKREPHFPLLLTNCRQANEGAAATFLQPSAVYCAAGTGRRSVPESSWSI